MCTGLAGAMVRRMSAESTRLSTREHDVLLLLADGANAAAIGQQLYMSESTVKSHIARIYQKLGASEPRAGVGHGDADRAALDGAASHHVGASAAHTRRRLSGNSAICLELQGAEWPERTTRLRPNSGFRRRHRFDMIEHGGLRPSRLSNANCQPSCRRTKMLDYLRIMLNAQKAKMDERGASAVEYGLLIAGIAALIVIVMFAFGGVLKRHLRRHLHQGLEELGRHLHQLITLLHEGRGPKVRGLRPFRGLTMAYAETWIGPAGQTSSTSATTAACGSAFCSRENCGVLGAKDESSPWGLHNAGLPAHHARTRRRPRWTSAVRPRSSTAC